MKILIVRLSALGDIVHALPVLAAIKQAMPDAQVDWLVEENYAAILSLATGLNRRVIVRAKTGGETTDWQPIGAIAVGLIQQILLFEILGFVPTAAILFFCVAYGFGSRRYLRDIVIAILLAFVAYVGFVHVLRLHLPAGLLEGVL